MFRSIKLLILGIATLTLAAPALQPQTPADVYKRRTITDGICATGTDAERYTVAEIQKAFNALLANMNKDNKLKPHNDDHTKIYPHKFEYHKGRSSDLVNALEKSPNSRNKISNTSYLEFPLMHNKYQGGDPKVDRVIAIAYGQKSKDYHEVLFSMVATHRGAEAATGNKNDLLPCTPVE